MYNHIEEIIAQMLNRIKDVVPMRLSGLKNIEADSVIKTIVMHGTKHYVDV